MNLTAVILIHDWPLLAQDLIQHLLDAEFRVCVHTDGNSPSVHSAVWNRFGSKINYVPRVRCGWGTYPIVQATLNSLKLIRDMNWDPRYVLLLSGADFPIQSYRSLRQFLSTNQGLEFIASRHASSHWEQRALQEDRFKYFYPFDWKKNPRLFRQTLKLQRFAGRYVGVRRPPPFIEPYVGSQWWALTWKTCQQLLGMVEDDRRIERYFRSTFLPDETMFQSLVRTFVPPEKISSSNLTYVEFDAQLRPIVWEDSDYQFLIERPFFFARKLSPFADILRQNLSHRWRSY